LEVDNWRGRFFAAGSVAFAEEFKTRKRVQELGEEEEEAEEEAEAAALAFRDFAGFSPSMEPSIVF
jgi:hypothetical protein